MLFHYENYCLIMLLGYFEALQAPPAGMHALQLANLFMVPIQVVTKLDTAIVFHYFCAGARSVHAGTGMQALQLAEKGCSWRTQPALKHPVLPSALKSCPATRRRWRRACTRCSWRSRISMAHTAGTENSYLTLRAQIASGNSQALAACMHALQLAEEDADGARSRQHIVAALAVSSLLVDQGTGNEELLLGFPSWI